MNNFMNSQVSQVEQVELTVGDKFRQAREALNFSIDEVSQKIMLRSSLLKSIENNHFVQENIPEAFMKGYVRSYAKFLHLSDEVWNAVDFGESEKNDLNKNFRSTKAVNQYSSHGRWVGCLTVLVLLIVLSMTGLWWWQSYQQSNQDRDVLVQNYIGTSEANSAKSQEQANQSATPVVEKATTAAEPKTEVEVSPIITTDSSLPASQSEMNSQASVVSQMQAPQESVQFLSQTPQPIQSVAPPEVVNAPEAVVPDMQSAVEMPVISSAPITTQGDLVIEIIHDSSWISVRDKNRKNLVQKEYKQGEVLTFTGDEFSLIIGAPSNVRITYKGQVYPLKIDGRVAKFKLSQP